MQDSVVIASILYICWSASSSGKITTLTRLAGVIKKMAD